MSELTGTVPTTQKLTGNVSVGEVVTIIAGYETLYMSVIDDYIQISSDQVHWEKVVALVDIKGADGYTPVKGVDYVDGVDGYTPVKGVDYVDGTDGKDGVSPTLAVEKITGGYRITITDANGEKTFDVLNGTTPTMSKLTLIGVTETEYDGTEEKAIDLYHIGENGNWYVGTEDTGIFASGVDVIDAEVGQTIVVKAVDENGKPTEWEAHVLPEGVSDWELVSTVTLEEDVAVFEFTELDASEISFSFFGRFNDTNDSLSNANTVCNAFINGVTSSVLGSSQIGYIRASGNNFLGVGLVRILGGYADYMTTLHPNSNSAIVTFTGRNYKIERISAFKLTSPDTTTFFKAGGVFSIYKKS